MSPRADTTVGQMTARGRTDPRLTYGQPPQRLWPHLVRGHLLRIPDMRSRHAYIRQAAHRSAQPRRVVLTHPAPRRPSLATGSPAASRPYVLALTRCGRCVLTRRAAGACPAPAGEPITQPTNQHSTPAVLDKAVPHQVKDRRAALIAACADG